MKHSNDSTMIDLPTPDSQKSKAQTSRQGYQNSLLSKSPSYQFIAKKRDSILKNSGSLELSNIASKSPNPLNRTNLNSSFRLKGTESSLTILDRESHTERKGNEETYEAYLAKI